jgi:hypothetical protein
MKIQDVISSPLKSKRFRAIIVDNGTQEKGLKRSVDFGSKYAKTYIDGATDAERANYIRRHSMNPLEKDIIDDFSQITPSLLSRHLLWGEHRSIIKNVDELNQRLGGVFK